MKPIIGVLARPYLTDNGRYVMCILENIRKAVIKNGGIPLMILPSQDMNYLGNKESVLTDDDKEILDTQLNLCDGILMPGGDRVFFYDNYICKFANDRHLPLLGICMGMQVMCNYNSENKNIKIDNHKEPQAKYVHEVTIDKNSKLFEIIQKEKIEVTSLHGYKVPNSGDYTSVASCDNIIEAVEKKDELFNIGVQWHPEINLDENDTNLFTNFINACKIYKTKKK